MNLLDEPPPSGDQPALRLPAAAAAAAAAGPAPVRGPLGELRVAELRRAALEGHVELALGEGGVGLDEIRVDVNVQRRLQLRGLDLRYYYHYCDFHCCYYYHHYDNIAKIHNHYQMYNSYQKKK